MTIRRWMHAYRAGGLARRFDKSESWVSRRVALISELSEAIQEKVRKGAIGAHAAMKHFILWGAAHKMNYGARPVMWSRASRGGRCGAPATEFST